ncbi:N/A [soil metagenome]
MPSPALAAAIFLTAGSLGLNPPVPAITPVPAPSTSQIGATAPSPAPTPIRRPLAAIVSIAPLKGIIEPILPFGSTIDILIPPGASEHGYELTPGRLQSVAKANLVIAVGFGLEPQLDRMAWAVGVGPQRIRLEDLPAVKERLKGMKQPERHDHAPGDHDDDHDEEHSGAHTHASGDPHAWLDPLIARAFADHVALTIALRETAADPARPATPGEQLAQRRIDADPAVLQLRQRISDLDARFRRLGANPKKTFIVGHNAYGWLARRYGLDFVPLAGLTASEPKPSDLRDAAALIRSKGVTTIFTEPQLSPQAARRLAAAAGVQVATLDPLGSGDYFAMMNANAAALEKSVGLAPPTAEDVKRFTLVANNDAPAPASPATSLPATPAAKTPALPPLPPDAPPPAQKNPA